MRRNQQSNDKLISVYARLAVGNPSAFMRGKLAKTGGWPGGFLPKAMILNGVDSIPTNMTIGDLGWNGGAIRRKLSPILQFGLDDGAWDKPKTIRSFEEIVRPAAPSIGGLPVTVHLCGSGFDTKKEFTLR